MDPIFKFPKTHRIVIEEQPTGCFVAQVGCVFLAFRDKEHLLDTLDHYLQDPKGVEKLYNQHAGRPSDVEAAHDHHALQAMDDRAEMPESPRPTRQRSGAAQLDPTPYDSSRYEGAKMPDDDAPQEAR